MYLSQNIRLLRKTSNFSQVELSERLGLSSNQVGKYEKGEAQPRIETLITLSELFDVNVSDLILLDLSQDKSKARPAAAAPKTEEEQDIMLRSLNDLLMKRVMQMEEELKKLDPERARELGIE